MSLVIRDLSVVFHGRIFAVDGVSADVAAGEILGLVGESGSGKSVTLRAILGLLHDHATVSGEVRWRGEDLLSLAPERRRRLRGRDIAMVFADPATALNPMLPIGVQITETLAAHTDLGAAARHRRALELLDQVGIARGPSRLGQWVHELPGTLRHRAMLAVALAASPALLLVDDLTATLDLTGQDEILCLLRHLKHELGLTMVLATSDPAVAAETCTRVAVIYAGRVCETGPLADVFAAPRHAYTAALLRALPGMSGRIVPIQGAPPPADAPLGGCAFLPRCAMVVPLCGIRPKLVEDGARSVACYARGRL
jgi:oligopeptide/dipeptide ABC transporter ATP-binding protein